MSLSTWLRLDRAADIRASPDHLEAVQRVRRSLVRRVHGKCSVSPAGSSDVLPMRYQRPGGIVGQSCDASGKKDSARPLPTTGSISKPQPVPEKTGTGRQSGGFSPGLGLGVPAEGRDWMGLGLVSAGQRSGLGQGLSAESRDWVGLGLTRDWTTC